MRPAKFWLPAFGLIILGNADARAAGTEPIAQMVPPIDACAAAAAKVGGRMGHAAGVSESGRPIYIFTVRKGGVDYDAVCDAESGLIQDVSPRKAH